MPGHREASRITFLAHGELDSRGAGGVAGKDAVVTGGKGRGSHR